MKQSLLFVILTLGLSASGLYKNKIDTRTENC